MKNSFRELLENLIIEKPICIELHLAESLETIIKSNPNIDSDVIRSYHAFALPDNNKSDRLLNHVLKMHRNNAITPNDHAELKHHLSILSNTNKVSRLKDVDSLAKLKAMTSGLDNKSLTKKEAIDKETPIDFENNDIIVKQHLTHASAIKGAQLHPENPRYNRCNGKAAWCLSADSDQGNYYFKNYSRNGPLYTIHNKKTKRTHALLADKNNASYDGKAEIELRNEHDNKFHNNQASIYGFMTGHPGIEHSKAGEHLMHIYPYAKKMLEKYPSTLSQSQITNILHDHDNEDSLAVVHHANATSDHLDYAINNYKKYKNTSGHFVTSSNNLNSRHINEIFKPNGNFNHHEQIEALGLPNTNDRHLDKVINNPNAYHKDVMAHVMTHKLLDRSQIDNILKIKNNPAEDYLDELVNEHSDKFDEDYVDHILSRRNNYSDKVKQAVVDNLDLQPHQIDFITDPKNGFSENLRKSAMLQQDNT